MSLRSKIVILLSAVVLAYAGLDHVMQRIFVFESFVDLEETMVKKDLDRVRDAIDGEVAMLARVCEMRAKSDVVRRLVKSRDAAQFSSALPADSLANDSIDLVCVCDAAKGVIQHSRVVDPRQSEKLAFVRGFLVGDSLVEEALVANPPKPIQGLLVTQRGPMMVASYPIYDSSENEPTRTQIGTLVVGRFLTQERVAGLVTRTSVDFEIWSKDDPDSPAEMREKLSSVEKPNSPVLVEDQQTEDSLNAYWCMTDVKAKPQLSLQARFDRPITAKGSIALRYALVSTIAAGLLLMLVLLNMVQRTVLEPLGHLTEHAVAIGNSEDFTKRIRSDREDEVGILAREFDGMIERVAESRAALVETARAAGMSEIATGVLHNVGNVLNSVNVSARIAVEKAKGSSPTDLKMVLETLRPNAADLSKFIENDPRGKHLYPLLDSLAERIADERQVLVHELEALTDGIEHIKQLVQSQQGYAGRVGVREMVSLASQIESAISITSQATSARSAIQILREFDEFESVSVDRHKFVEILVNLIQNARQAVTESGVSPMRVTIRLKKLPHQRARIEVADNGVGIAPENLARVFTHGFTTKKNGHGFGLHASANAATEMGGNLSAHSDGKGLGATFALELPLMVPTANRVTS
ncbi:MAG: ATP-binding protein [Planctomycetota bacterium]|nr:ATP-binding protein [Planctomycetota bacterium]